MVIAEVINGIATDFIRIFFYWGSRVIGVSSRLTVNDIPNSILQSRFLGFVLVLFERGPDKLILHVKLLINNALKIPS